MSKPRTERERMVNGQAFDPGDPELCELRLRGQRLIRRYNTLDDDAQPARDSVLAELLGRIGAGCLVQSGFRCEYGFTVELGDRVFMNYGCVLLDVCPIRIGNRTLLGPNVQLLTPTHPLVPEERTLGTTDGPEAPSMVEKGKPITIGDDCWLGGGVIVNPGVTIGDGTTVGSGSVVTKDLPPRVLAAGNPARAIRDV